MSTEVRQRILDAALPLFVANGLAGARTEEIRASAGVSNGSLFHAFPNKEAIAAALYVAAIASYQEALHSELRTDRAADLAIRALVRSHWKWVEVNALQARFLFGMGRPDWSADVGAQTREMNARLAGDFSAWWQERKAAGEVVDLSVEAAQAILFGPSLMAMRSMLAGAGSRPSRGLAAALADAAVRSLATGGR